jgi:DNA-binding NarL/FixJ family response regulator
VRAIRQKFPKTYRARYDWYFRVGVPEWYWRVAPPREAEVVRLRLSGLSLREIGERMNISKRTVWGYRVASYRRYCQGDMFEKESDSYALSV